MQCKKIRGIEKGICTCEQKIAYNYAFAWSTQIRKISKSDNMQSVKSAAYQEIINYVIQGIKREGIDKKYNIDAIIHAFRNGLETYAKGCEILTSYNDIGKTFPILYSIE